MSKNWTDQIATEKVTLAEAIKELGWFPTLFSGLVGAPSLFSIFQMAFKDFRLSAAFQWIIDGYNHITAEMAQVVEPFIVPVIAWINAQFGWDLVLNPVWRPVFLILMIFPMAGARGAWREGARIKAVRFAGLWGAVFLIGSLFSGLTVTTAAEASRTILAFLIVVLALPWFIVPTVIGVKAPLKSHSRVLARAITVFSGFLVAAMILAADVVIKLFG